MCLHVFYPQMQGDVYCRKRHCRERDARIRAETPHQLTADLGRAVNLGRLALEGKMSTKKFKGQGKGCVRKLVDKIQGQERVGADHLYDLAVAKAFENAAKMENGHVLTEAEVKHEQIILHGVSEARKVVDQHIAGQRCLGEAKTIRATRSKVVLPPIVLGKS